MVNKESRSVVEKQLGGKETSVWLEENGSTVERTDSRTDEFSLDEAQLLEIVDMLGRTEELYGQPHGHRVGLCQGAISTCSRHSPITAYVPLVPEMQTKPDEDRILYLDAALTEGLTTNAPISHLTLDWLFKFRRHMGGAVPWAARSTGRTATRTRASYSAPGGRYYMNLSQLLTLFGAKNIAKLFGPADALLGELLENLDEYRYRARESVDA